MTGADNRDVVHTLGEVWKQIRDLDTAFAVSLERALCAEQFCIGAHELVFRFAETRRSLLPMKFIEQRLGIEGFQVAGAATEEKEDYRLRLCRLMRFLGRGGVDALRARFFLRQHRSERQRAKTTAGVA